MSTCEGAAEARKPPKESLINNEWIVGYSNTHRKKYYFNIYTNDAVWNVHEMQSKQPIKKLKKHSIREPDAPPAELEAAAGAPDDKSAHCGEPVNSLFQPNSPTSLLAPLAQFASGNFQNNQAEQNNQYQNIWARPNPVQYAIATQSFNPWTNLQNVPPMTFGNGPAAPSVPTNFSHFPAGNFGNAGSFVNMHPNFMVPNVGNYTSMNPNAAPAFHNHTVAASVNLPNFGKNFLNVNSNSQSDSSDFVSTPAPHFTKSKFNSPNAPRTFQNTSSASSKTYSNSPENVGCWIKATGVPMSQRFLKDHKSTDHRKFTTDTGMSAPMNSFVQSQSETEESDYDVQDMEKEFLAQQDASNALEEESGVRMQLKEGDLRLKLRAKRRASISAEFIGGLPEGRKRKNSYAMESGDFLETEALQHISEDNTPEEEETNDETDAVIKSELAANKKVIKSGCLGLELLKMAGPDVSRDVCYVICDTNIFIKDLSFIKKMVFCDQDCTIRIVVPWRIHSELEGILKGPVNRNITKKKAKEINLFLHDECLKERSVFIGQKPPSIIHCTNPDDEILDCCMQYVANKNHVVLITNDKSLVIKARYSNIQVYNLDQMYVIYDKVMKQGGDLMKMKIRITNSLIFDKAQERCDNVITGARDNDPSDGKRTLSQTIQNGANADAVNIWEGRPNAENVQNVQSASWQGPSNLGIVPNVSPWQNATNAGNMHNISPWQVPSNPGMPAQQIWQNMQSVPNLQLPMNAAPFMLNPQMSSAPWQLPTMYNPAFGQPNSFGTFPNATFDGGIVKSNVSTEQESSSTNSPKVSTKSNNTKSSTAVSSSRNSSTLCLDNLSIQESENKVPPLQSALTADDTKKSTATTLHNSDDLRNTNSNVRKIQLKRKPMDTSCDVVQEKPRRLWRNQSRNQLERPSVPIWSFQCSTTSQNQNEPSQPTSARNFAVNTNVSSAEKNAYTVKNQNIPTSNDQNVATTPREAITREGRDYSATSLNTGNRFDQRKSQSSEPFENKSPSPRPKFQTENKSLANTNWDLAKYKFNKRPELNVSKHTHTIDVSVNADKYVDGEETVNKAAAVCFGIGSKTMQTRLWKRMDEWTCIFVQAMEHLLSNILRVLKVLNTMCIVSTADLSRMFNTSAESCKRTLNHTKLKLDRGIGDRLVHFLDLAEQCEPSEYLLPPPWGLHEAAVCLQRLHERDNRTAAAAGRFAAAVEAATSRHNTDEIVKDERKRKKINFSTVRPGNCKIFMKMYDHGSGLVTALKEIYSECEDLSTTEHILSELLQDIRYAGGDKHFLELDQFVELADTQPDLNDNADMVIAEEGTSLEARVSNAEIIQYLKKHFREWDGYNEETECLARSNGKKRKKDVETLREKTGKDAKMDKSKVIMNKKVTHFFDSKTKTIKNVFATNAILKDNTTALNAKEIITNNNAVNEKSVNAELTKHEPKILRNLKSIPKFEELLKKKKAMGNFNDDLNYEASGNLDYKNGEYDLDAYSQYAEEQDGGIDEAYEEEGEVDEAYEENGEVDEAYEEDGEVDKAYEEDGEVDGGYIDENQVHEDWEENLHEKEINEENNNGSFDEADLIKVASAVIMVQKNLRAYLVVQVRKVIDVELPNGGGDASLLPSDAELLETLGGLIRCLRDVMLGTREAAAALVRHLLRLAPDAGLMPRPDVVYQICLQHKDILQNAAKHFETLHKIVGVLPFYNINGDPKEATNTLCSFIRQQTFNIL